MEKSKNAEKKDREREMLGGSPIHVILNKQISLSRWIGAHSVSLHVSVVSTQFISICLRVVCVLSLYDCLFILSASPKF